VYHIDEDDDDNDDDDDGDDDGDNAARAYGGISRTPIASKRVTHENISSRNSSHFETVSMIIHPLKTDA